MKLKFNSVNIKVRIINKEKENKIQKWIKRNLIIISIILIFFSIILFLYSLENNRKANLRNNTNKFNSSFYLVLSYLITSSIFYLIRNKYINYLFLILELLIIWIIDLIYRQLIFIQSFYPTIYFLKKTIYISIFLESLTFYKKNLKEKKILKITCFFVFILILIPFYFEIDENKFNLFPYFNINSNTSNTTNNYTNIDSILPFIKPYNNINYNDLFKSQYYQPYDELYSEYENRINIKPKDGEKYCYNWTLGLNKIRIESNQIRDSCYIKTPKKCYIELLSKDYTNFNSCDGRSNDKKVLIEYRRNSIPLTYSNISYPDTTNFTLNESVVGVFHYRVLARLSNADIIKNPEIVVNFNKNDIGNIIINITPKEDLIKERSLLYEKYPNVIYKNVIIIYLDGLSRRHFLRKLPKSSKLLEDYLYNNKDKKEKMSSFQFLKYINFLGITENNCIPMFYGNSKGNADKYSIVNEFKKKGYITCGTSNQCHRELFLLNKNTNYKFVGFDHENFALFCDPNYNPPNNNKQFELGLYSKYRRCLYNKDTFEYVFEYGKKFLEAYKEQRKFLRLGFIDSHETSLELIKYLDDSLSDFILYLINNFNNSTSIFIVSDHGGNMQSREFNFLAGQDFRYERDLGTFFLIISDNYNSNFKNLNYNQQILITPYDIYNTLMFILQNDKKEYSFKGQSIFEEINGKERKCNNYKVEYGNDIEERCPCINY